ncbi:hypothetical protein N2U02_004479 [Salmonella enterica]|nr:hypothetical protein [Salmonella enterica]
MNNKTAAKSEYETRLETAVSNYKSASKPLVTLLIEAVDHFWTNSQSADKIANFVNAVGGFPKLYEKAKTTFVELAPIQFVEVDKETGKVSAKQSDSWVNIKKEAKKGTVTQLFNYPQKLKEKTDKYKAALEAYKALDLNSILSTPSKDKDDSFKSTTPAKAVAKASTTGAALIARLMLSDPAMTFEDARSKISKAIEALSQSEIETAKKKITDKEKYTAPVVEAPAQEPVTETEPA